MTKPPDSWFRRFLATLIPARHAANSANGPQTVFRMTPQLTDPDTLMVEYTQTRKVAASKATWLDNKIIAWDNSHPVSGRIDILRTLVMRKMEANNWRTMAVISPTPGAGKSFVAVNLAISLAQNPNKSVMLVDFDLRRPQVAAKLGLSCEKTLLDYLTGKSDLAGVLVNPGIPRLVVAPVCKGVANASELLSHKQVTRMIQDVRDRYDSRVVIFDLPPMLSIDDALIILPHIDCALLVLGDGEHTSAEIEETVRLLGDTGLVGMVVNRSQANLKVEGY